jgi:hypothetical protein
MESQVQKALAIDSHARRKSSWINAHHRRDALLDIASPSGLFENMDSLGPTQSPEQEESMPQVSPIDRLSDVLKELFEDNIFGGVDDDFVEDTFALLEPTPLDTSRMNVVDRLPLNLYNAQNHHISIFREMYCTNNNAEHGPLGFSQHSITVMPCDASDPSIFDATYKRKRQVDGGVDQSIPKSQLEQQGEEEAQSQDRQILSSCKPVMRIDNRWNLLTIRIQVFRFSNYELCH